MSEVVSYRWAKAGWGDMPHIAPMGVERTLCGLTGTWPRTHGGPGIRTLQRLLTGHEYYGCLTCRKSWSKREGAR